MGVSRAAFDPLSKKDRAEIEITTNEDYQLKLGVFLVNLRRDDDFQRGVGEVRWDDLKAAGMVDQPPENEDGRTTARTHDYTGRARPRCAEVCRRATKEQSSYTGRARRKGT